MPVSNICRMILNLLGVLAVALSNFIMVAMGREAERIDSTPAQVITGVLLSLLSQFVGAVPLEHRSHSSSVLDSLYLERLLCSQAAHPSHHCAVAALSCCATTCVMWRVCAAKSACLRAPAAVGHWG